MTKDIYIITNDINDLIYVGQTNNVKQRWAQHICESKKTDTPFLIDQAIHNIGIKHFKINVIEKNVENYNERETYWIKKLNTITPNGYNVITGNGGVEVLTAKLTEETLSNLINDIKTTDITFDKLATKYNISPAVVSAINLGHSYYNQNIKYPIRPKIYSTELFKRLVYSLKYEQDKTMVQIAKEYDIDYSMLSDINQGKIKKVDWLQYPIRSGKVSFNIIDHIDEIIELLKNSNMMQKDIAIKFNVSTNVISQINRGLNYKKENEIYPIRRDYRGNVDKLKLSPDMQQYLETQLINTDRSLRDIAQEFECTVTSIMNFNNGVIYKYRDNNKSYPLRKKKQPVSTICA